MLTEILSLLCPAAHCGGTTQVPYHVGLACSKAAQARPQLRLQTGRPAIHSLHTLFGLFWEAGTVNVGEMSAEADSILQQLQEAQLFQHIPALCTAPAVQLMAEAEHDKTRSAKGASSSGSSRGNAGVQLSTHAQPHSTAAMASQLLALCSWLPTLHPFNAVQRLHAATGLAPAGMHLARAVIQGVSSRLQLLQPSQLQKTQLQKSYKLSKRLCQQYRERTQPACGAAWMPTCRRSQSCSS